MKESKIRDIFGTEGCVVIPSFFSEAELSAIYPIISKAHQRWLEINHKEYLKHKMINSNNLTLSDHFDCVDSQDRIDLFKFITSDKIQNLIETLIGKDAFFLGSQVFFNPKDHSKDGYWHRDTQYTGLSVEDQKKAIINEPVLHFHIPFIDDELFELVPGSHKRWDSEDEFEVRMKSNNSPLLNSKSFDCKRGEVRVFSAHAIHRGKKYGVSPKRFVFDPLFALRTEKSSSFINPKAMPSTEILKQLPNRRLFY